MSFGLRLGGGGRGRLWVCGCMGWVRTAAMTSGMRGIDWIIVDFLVLTAYLISEVKWAVRAQAQAQAPSGGFRGR